MSPDGVASSAPPSAEPAGIPASRPFDAAQVRHCLQARHASAFYRAGILCVWLHVFAA